MAASMPRWASGHCNAYNAATMVGRFLCLLTALALSGCAATDPPADAVASLDAGPPDVGPDANCASGGCECTTAWTSGRSS